MSQFEACYNFIMKAAIKWLLAGLYLTHFCGVLISPALADPPSVSDRQQCVSLRTRSQWVSFREQYLRTFTVSAAPRENEDFREMLSRSQLTYEQLASCLPELRLQGLGNCFERFIDFTRNLGRFSESVPDVRQPSGIRHFGSGYRFEVPDADYLRSQPLEAMQIPSEFLLPTLQQAQVALERRGVSSVRFQSGLTSHDRIIFHERLARYDRYFLIEGDNLSTIDVILVENRTDGQRPQIYFRENTLTPGHAHHQATTNVSSCINCHSNGLREIVPALPLSTALERERLQSINQRIHRTGSPDWHNTLHPNRFGPALGTRSRHGCINCHDGQTRSALNWMTDIGEVYKKVVQEGSMPPGQHLSRRQRIQMFQELYRDGQRALRAWMTEIPCSHEGPSLNQAHCPQ